VSSPPSWDNGQMPDVLLVAATERELGPFAGLACGIGPVEAAAATARMLALGEHAAVLHVGVAGARGLAPGTIVIGAEAVYCDLAAAIPVVDRVLADAALVEAARRAVPDAPILPIGTSAAVGSVGHEVAVEAMEGFGVLRAAALAGVPALEVRVVSNEIGEDDRTRWDISGAIASLHVALPALIAALGGAVAQR
jgi:futalosine hydrolase